MNSKIKRLLLTFSIFAVLLSVFVVCSVPASAASSYGTFSAVFPKGPIRNFNYAVIGQFERYIVNSRFQTTVTNQGNNYVFTPYSDLGWYDCWFIVPLNGSIELSSGSMIVDSSIFLSNSSSTQNFLSQVDYIQWGLCQVNWNADGSIASYTNSTYLHQSGLSYWENESVSYDYVSNGLVNSFMIRFKFNVSNPYYGIIDLYNVASTYSFSFTIEPSTADLIEDQTNTIVNGWTPNPQPPAGSGSVNELTGIENQIDAGIADGIASGTDTLSNFSSLISSFRPTMTFIMGIFSDFFDATWINALVGIGLALGLIAFILGLAPSIASRMHRDEIADEMRENRAKTYAENKRYHDAMITKRRK